MSKHKSNSAAEEQLLFHIRREGLPAPMREYLFHPQRQWRFDFAWPTIRLAVEVQGLLYGGEVGRHQRSKGYENDCRKHNAALIYGWRLVYLTPHMIASGEAVGTLTDALLYCVDGHSGSRADDEGNGSA